MKKGILIFNITLFTLLTVLFGNVSAQNVWTHKNNFTGIPREQAFTVAVDTNSDGLNDIAFIGGGGNHSTTWYKDFWEYDPTTDTWSQKTDMPGGVRASGKGFSLHGKVYMGSGSCDTLNLFRKDFYQYNISTNTWTRKNDLPGGSGRWGSMMHTFNDRAFYGFGNAGSVSSPIITTDFYEYNDTTDSWTTLASFPGTPRFEVSYFSLDLNGDGIDDKFYVGPGTIGSNSLANNDFWEYDRGANAWTRKSNVPGNSREASCGFAIKGKGYMGLGWKSGTVGLNSDMYEYDANHDRWSLISPYPGTARCVVSEFTIGDTAYIVGGFDGVVKGDMYKYVPFLYGRNTVRGNVFVDANSNCRPDSGEFVLSGWVITATPGPYYASTDSNGNYALDVDSGSYTITELPSNIQTTLGTTVCPSGNSYQVSFSGYGADTSGYNFGDTVHYCPYLTVDITSTGRRRCFDNLTVAHVCNNGFATAYNVNVYVKLPEHVLLDYTFYNFTYDADSNMIFQVDSIPAGFCGDLYIVDYVSCADVEYLGLTVCTKAWITPANVCLPPDSGWNHADLVDSASCYSGDTVLLKVTNIGSGNMDDSTQYRIYLDSVLVYQGMLELPVGGILALLVPSNGQTVRIETDQPAHHPFTSETFAWSEGCGLSIPIAVSRGYVAMFPTSDGQPEKSVDCIVIDGAWDPNSKTVSPSGITANHYVKPATPLNYELTFQNTGTDSAFNIVIVDTLSPDLDPATLKVTGSSHHYTLAITGKIRPVLTFTFKNIGLPDSSVNLLGSEGFVSYTIKPYDNTPLNTVISNTAYIYFDFNPGVATNPVFSTISNYVERDLTAKIVGGTLLYTGIKEAGTSDLGVNISPNPNNGQFTVEIDNPINGHVDFSVTDMTGKTVWAKSMDSFSPGNLPVDLGQISKGIYIFAVRTAGTSVNKKVVIE